APEGVEVGEVIRDLRDPVLEHATAALPDVHRPVDRNERNRNGERHPCEQDDGDQQPLPLARQKNQECGNRTDDQGEKERVVDVLAAREIAGAEEEITVVM